MEAEASSRSERHLVVIKDASWLAQFKNASNPWMARYMYGIVFLLANLLAWATRDYGNDDILKEMRSNVVSHENSCREMPLISISVQNGKFALIQNVVSALKESCASAWAALYPSIVVVLFRFIFFPVNTLTREKLFFIIMFLSTAGTSRSKDPRDLWHSGWWLPKILLWVGLTIVTFLAPSSFILYYGEVAHVGAGMFLIIQLISLISFITWLNDWCRSEKNAERCHINVMLIATTSYIICIVGIIMMYVFYASSLLNIFFITWTLVLLQLMTSVSLHPKIDAGILAPGLMGLYVVYLCWCAIRSEPAVEGKSTGGSSAGSDWFDIISFVVALLAIVIATFSTGIDSACFQLRRKESETGDGVPYSYAFFHFVFAVGGMYFAMLMIGWAGKHNNNIKKWTIDVGWTSAWVRIVNEWVAVCVYLWMVVTPTILKDGAEAEEDEPV